MNNKSLKCQKYRKKGSKIGFCLKIFVLRDYGSHFRGKWIKLRSMKNALKIKSKTT